MSIQKSRIYEDFTKINRVLDDAEKEHATAADLQRRKAACFDWAQKRFAVIEWDGDQGVPTICLVSWMVGGKMWQSSGGDLFEAVESAMAKEREGE